MITVKIKGLTETLRAIRALPAKLEREIEAEVKAAALEIARNAKRDAPVDQGVLKNEITTKKIDSLHYQVISQASYSQYVEFGTRSKRRVPPGLEDYAKQVIKEAENELTAREAIFEWCRRNNIGKEAWYPIYVAIMTKGIRPQPFFFKQVEVVEPKLVKNIENILNDQRL